MIEAARTKLRLSLRELAKEMKTRKAAVDQSTLWVWIHTTNGYPAPRSFTASHLRALASSLKLKETDVRKALDESRAIYAGRPEPTPRPQLEGLDVLIETLENSTKATVKRMWVLHLAKSLRATAQAADEKTAGTKAK